jgi:hypothetical protein
LASLPQKPWWPPAAITKLAPRPGSLATVTHVALLAIHTQSRGQPVPFPCPLVVEGFEELCLRLTCPCRLPRVFGVTTTPSVQLSTLTASARQHPGVEHEVQHDPLDLRWIGELSWLG